MSLSACLVDKTPVKVFKNGVKMWNLDDALNRNKSPVNLSDKPVEMYHSENNTYTKICENGHKIWVKIDAVDYNNPPVINPIGVSEWYQHGVLHRLHRVDGPAIEYPNGDKKWYQNGKLHREDGPAIKWANGDKEWWENGKRLRCEEAPVNSSDKYQVEVFKDGTKLWRKDGILHREDGPAVEMGDGSKSWYKDGKLHRENGPAVEDNGYKAWYKNNKCHREDGPAIEYQNGAKEWWENGKQLRCEEAPVNSSDNCEAEISNEVKQN